MTTTRNQGSTSSDYEDEYEDEYYNGFLLMDVDLPHHIIQTIRRLALPFEWKSRDEYSYAKGLFSKYHLTLSRDNKFNNSTEAESIVGRVLTSIGRQGYLDCAAMKTDWRCELLHPPLHVDGCDVMCYLVLIPTSDTYLTTLKSIYDGMKQYGCVKERFSFKPHICLGSIRHSSKSTKMVDVINETIDNFGVESVDYWTTGYMVSDVEKITRDYATLPLNNAKGDGLCDVYRTCQSCKPKTVNKLMVKLALNDSISQSQLQKFITKRPNINAMCYTDDNCLFIELKPGTIMRLTYGIASVQQWFNLIRLPRRLKSNVDIVTGFAKRYYDHVKGCVDASRIVYHAGESFSDAGLSKYSTGSSIKKSLVVIKRKADDNDADEAATNSDIKRQRHI